jgi:hypothetical protein
MAWKKVIIDPKYGVSVEHFCLIDARYSHREQITLFVYGGWVNKEAYDANMEPIIRETIEFSSGEAPQLSAGVISFAETKIRALPQFEGSESV